MIKARSRQLFVSAQSVYVFEARCVLSENQMFKDWSDDDMSISDDCHVCYDAYLVFAF